MMKSKSVSTVLSVIIAIAIVVGLFPVRAEAAGYFPYNVNYNYGLPTVKWDTDPVTTAWNNWRDKYVTSDGAGGYKRVWYDSNTYKTCSEGMGYGMLFAVYFDDQQLFNDFWNYVKLHLNSNGLMAWDVRADGVNNDNNCATDGDEDIAAALCFAHKKWGSWGDINYYEDAKTLINNIYNKCVDHDTFVLLNGDAWGKDSTDPSYYTTAWYRMFAEVTGNNNWYNVMDKCYEVVNNVHQYNNGTGLVPDFCKPDGTRDWQNRYNSESDAFRYWWRVATDYCWYGDYRAKANSEKIANFFKGVGASNIGSSYKITGECIAPQYHDSREVAMSAATMLCQDDTSARDTWWNEMKYTHNMEWTDYYRQAVRLFGLMFVSGNMPNLWEN